MNHTWAAVWSDDWKAHVVPTALVDDLVAEMRARGCEGEIARRPVTKYGLDCGGMCRVDRPVEEFPFCGLRIGAVSEYVQYFHDRLVALAPRKFGKKVYYKLHTHWNCIVLTPAMHRQLAQALARRIDRAEARATAFYRDKKPSNVVLAEIAEKVTGAKIPPEALGPDRQARFRKKARA